MPKAVWLLLASAWTVNITVLCLVNFNNFPSVDVNNFDKYVHAGFHFLFAVLWYLYFSDHERSRSSLPLILKILSASLLFGIALEIAQAVFTSTRQADVKDVAANFTGALLAGAMLFGYRKWIERAQ